MHSVLPVHLYTCKIDNLLGVTSDLQKLKKINRSNIKNEIISLVYYVQAMKVVSTAKMYITCFDGLCNGQNYH